MITISEYTTKTPLQMIGEFAGFCWGANTSDNEKNIKRAIDCIMSEHGRTEEFPDLYLIIENVDAKTLRELYTHIGGSPTRLQASTRYIDYEKKGVPVITPPSVNNKLGAKEVWDESVYFPTEINYANVNSNVNLRTCYSAYLWKFNNDGVDMYFYNENDEEEGYDFIRHFSFEELLSDVDVTDW
jgi:hypothetical protein